MAETESLPKKHHPLPTPHPNSSKYFTRFLYKSAFVLLFLVIIPLFPSPEFISQSVPTRSWELLHLIFVGIAVSYGLFSRRNEEESSDKETSDNAPSSYISRIFHVSSVFDDDVIENSPQPSDKVDQTWSSQYRRNDDPVVVREKPLLLPIRSLKTSVSDETEHEPSTMSGSVVKDDRVLPSPIPWRSRSGRIELKDGINQSFGPIEEEPRLARSQTLEPPRIRVSNSSQSLRLSPTKSFSLETKKPRSGDDFVRKKSSPVPLPPPLPPPPPMIPKSTSTRPTSFSDDLPPKSVRTIRSGNGKAWVEEEEEGSEFAEIPKDGFAEELVSESDEDQESEEDSGFEASTDNGGGPDVDKKADEFIAKFREQIRLQRIESIRSSAEMSKRIHR